MKLCISILGLLIILHCSYAPPVTPDKSKEQETDQEADLEQYMEYHRYLKEVVQALESDPEFRERLEKANEDDIKSGKIAEQLDFVNHNVRSKLDEIKRRELERLRHLATKQFELDNNLDAYSGKVPSNEHLDQENPHTFEIEDLKKLIKKTTQDIEAADKKRKEEFKEYEMEKEFEKKQKLEAMDEAEKKEFERKIKEEEDAKKHHQPLHHPGSKQQLEEVWEKQDHMDNQQFDPKVFFMTHDVDGNGVWDANEVKALFIKELDKVYAPNGPNKDMHERAEEMERMREHVFKENDNNGDGLIDFNEFIMGTKKAEFNRDEGWKSVDENEIYSQAEYEAFERERREQVAFLQQRGLVDAHGRPVPGAHHQIQQAMQQYHAYKMQHQQYQQMPPHQAPPPGYAQVPQHQGFQQPPQGYQQPPQGYQQPPQGYQQPPQGYQQPPQGFQQPQQAYQQPPQGYQQPPQGYQQPPQGYQQPPQGYQQPQAQYQQPQGQAQGQQQGQVQTQQQTQGQGQPPVNVNQGQPPVNMNQVPNQHDPAIGQGQQTQGQSPPAQIQPQAQASQTQGQPAVAGQQPVPQSQNPNPSVNAGGNQ